MSLSPNILITGATGTIGKELTKHLAEKNVPFRAMVRSIDAAKELARLPQAELIEGNFDNVASVENTLIGIEKAFLLTNSSENAEIQQINFVKAAKKAGVKHIVKLSQWAADVHSPVRFLKYHAVVENFIKESGIEYTFLRPNLFMQGLLGFRETIIKQNQFFGAVGDSQISIVDIRDIAEVAVVSMTEGGHKNKFYNITGPESISHYEMAEMLSSELGRQITFVDVTSEMLQNMLLGVGFPEWQAKGLVEDYAHYKLGEASEISPDVEKLTGKPARNFADFAKDHAELFGVKI
ncbi:SDR family oxidoreductase [Dyadobacter sp. CY312]|uniref:SDR family oxidoreductase n=1 Tax=Dyadobacter sp. CY312 TaxID=2907303 RepID=UPI001F3B5EF8|nr:SDR family oxidoreductase [Dyadobacter sp. CY312]MCE7040855.1 SDR family oxidoreductase [Dyadobacter sp. CY312]